MYPILSPFAITGSYTWECALCEGEKIFVIPDSVCTVRDVTEETSENQPDRLKTPSIDIFMMIDFKTDSKMLRNLIRFLSPCVKMLIFFKAPRADNKANFVQ